MLDTGMGIDRRHEIIGDAKHKWPSLTELSEFESHSARPASGPANLSRQGIATLNRVLAKQQDRFGKFDRLSPTVWQLKSLSHIDPRRSLPQASAA